MSANHVHTNGKSYPVGTEKFYYNLSGKYYEPYNGQYRDEHGVENDGWSVDTCDYILVPSADGDNGTHRTGSVVIASVATEGNVKGHAPNAQAEINRLSQIIEAKDKVIDGLQMQLANATAVSHATVQPAPVAPASKEVAIIEPTDDLTEQLEAAVVSKSRQTANA